MEWFLISNSVNSTKYEANVRASWKQVLYKTVNKNLTWVRNKQEGEYDAPHHVV